MDSIQQYIQQFSRTPLPNNQQDMKSYYIVQLHTLREMTREIEYIIKQMECDLKIVNNI